MDEGFKSLHVSVDSATRVATLQLNMPARSNALTSHFFEELPRAIDTLDRDPAARVIVLSGAGKNFCSGIDLSLLSHLLTKHQGEACEGRKRESLRRGIKAMQSAISSLEKCRKPVIAAIHGACIGGGIDIVTACDFRYCAQSAYFSVKEVDLGITADLGTLQRLPRIVGEGNARELALTARTFSGPEALRLGLVQRVFPDDVALREQVAEIAADMAKKSPLALVGTKQVLNFSRDHSVDDSLEYTATWNSAMLLSSDITEALQARQKRKLPQFSKL